MAGVRRMQLSFPSIKILKVIDIVADSMGYEIYSAYDLLNRNLKYKILIAKMIAEKDYVETLACVIPSRIISELDDGTTEVIKFNGTELINGIRYLLLCKLTADEFNEKLKQKYPNTDYRIEPTKKEKTPIKIVYAFKKTSSRKFLVSPNGIEEIVQPHPLKTGNEHTYSHNAVVVMEQKGLRLMTVEDENEIHKPAISNIEENVNLL
jgi:hypothetical protein